MEILTGIIAFVSGWPLPLETTFMIGAVVYKIGDLLWKRNWSKLEKVVMNEALPLFSELIEDEAKRDKVVVAVWNAMPKHMRMLATAEQVEKFVDLIYNTQVKPQAKREGMVKANKEEPLMRIGFNENYEIEGSIFDISE